MEQLLLRHSERFLNLKNPGRLRKIIVLITLSMTLM